MCWVFSWHVDFNNRKFHNKIIIMINFKTLIKSFGYAFEGIKLGLSVDQNLRIHSFVGTFMIILSLFLRLQKSEFFLVVLAVFFVWFAELINTAIEEMTNLIVQEHRKEAKIAKDVAAAAVLLSAIYSAIVGIAIVLPALISLFNS